jgi:hypothetical protein
MKIYVEVTEDVDNSWVKGKPKPTEQEIAKDDNFIIAGFRYGFSTGRPRGTDHSVLLKSVHIGVVNQTSSEGIRLRILFSNSIAPSLWGHDYELLRS